MKALAACVAVLAGCAATPGPVERPADWRHLMTTPDLEMRYDLANIRYAENGHLMVKIRAAPTRPAAFTHSILTYAIDCKEKRFAIVEEAAYQGSTRTGYAKHAAPYFLTAQQGSQALAFMEKGCQNFKDS